MRGFRGTPGRHRFFRHPSQFVSLPSRSAPGHRRRLGHRNTHGARSTAFVTSEHVTPVCDAQSPAHRRAGSLLRLRFGQPHSCYRRAQAACHGRRRLRPQRRSLSRMLPTYVLRMRMPRIPALPPRWTLLLSRSRRRARASRRPLGWCQPWHDSPHRWVCHPLHQQPCCPPFLRGPARDPSLDWPSLHTSMVRRRRPRQPPAVISAGRCWPASA